MNLYLTNRFFYIGLGIILLVILSHGYSWLFFPSLVLWGMMISATLYEYFKVRSVARRITASREVHDQWSMGDPQEIVYTLSNTSSSHVDITLTDELPYQLQHRKEIFEGRLSAQSTAAHEHQIRTTERGVYRFGDIHLYLSLSWLGLAQYRKTYASEVDTAVYPSYIQMKNMEMHVFSQTASLAGIRRVREIGENDEFEQIRNYVIGDNVKSINWKATSRRGELMVNQYENSKSQQIYCIIDKGRSMKMPFDGLSLLDYAINSSLVISNIVLKKYDKIGLLTFSSKIGSIINADAQKGQLQKIVKALYDQKTQFDESNFTLLYHTIRQRIRRRSILLLFTNFEQPQDMRRQLRYLKSLNRNHLLVVIFFTNAEIESTAQSKPTSVEELYTKTFAQENIMGKERIVTELRRNGIQVILSTPEDLSVNTINKYLEIKAKRMK